MAPRWSRLLSVLTLSRDYGRPPSTWLGGEPWGTKDQLLTLAHETYRTALVCGCCGVPTRWAHGIKTAGGSWEINQTVCNVGAARDKWAQDNKTPPNGAITAPRLVKGWE